MDPKGPVSSCCTNRSPEPSKRCNRSPSSDEARHENSSGVTRIGMEREAASRIPHAGATWPDTIDDIFGGDCVVTLGYVTPASSVVLTPLTNFALRDRSAGTLTVLNSSVGVWKKLERKIGRASCRERVYGL